MKRLLLAAALGAGLLGTIAPSANACEFRQCSWGILICSTVNCPRYCVYVSELNRSVCVIN